MFFFSAVNFGFCTRPRFACFAWMAHYSSNFLSPLPFICSSYRTNSNSRVGESLGCCYRQPLHRSLTQQGCSASSNLTQRSQSSKIRTPVLERPPAVPDTVFLRSGFTRQPFSLVNSIPRFAFRYSRVGDEFTCGLRRLLRQFGRGTTTAK